MREISVVEKNPGADKNCPRIILFVRNSISSDLRPKYQIPNSKNQDH
jgi:hypothetical protein